MACSDLAAPALTLPVIVVCVVSVFIAAIIERNTGWFDKVKDTAMTLFIVFLDGWFLGLFHGIFITASIKACCLGDGIGSRGGEVLGGR